MSIYMRHKHLYIFCPFKEVHQHTSSSDSFFLNFLDMLFLTPCSSREYICYSPLTGNNHTSGHFFEAKCIAVDTTLNSAHLKSSLLPLSFRVVKKKNVAILHLSIYLQHAEPPVNQALPFSPSANWTWSISHDAAGACLGRKNIVMGV